MDSGIAKQLAALRIVEPVRVLRDDARADPRVVDHHVEHKAHPDRVQIVRETRELRGRPQLGLDGAIVGVGEVGPVPVVAAAIGRRAVRRRDPHCGDAEVSQVRDALAKTGEVAAVPLSGVQGVEAAGDAKVVIGRVAVLEAIRHHEVHDLRAPGACVGRKRLRSLVARHVRGRRCR